MIRIQVNDCEQVLLDGEMTITFSKVRADVAEVNVTLPGGLVLYQYDFALDGPPQSIRIGAEAIPVDESLSRS